MTSSIFGTAGPDELIGTDEIDIIFGLDGVDNIEGRDGNDTLFGGPGSDELNGGRGNDWLFGGKGDDILLPRQGETNVVFGDIGNDSISIVFSFSGNNLLFGNQGQDDIGGAAGSDTIYGGQGNDSLNGEGGNDWLFGDAGNDTLRGKGGSNRFVIGPGMGRDIILDYDDTDSIVLQGGISESDLEFVNTSENIVGGAATDDLLINLISTGETLAVISGTTVNEFNQIKIIEPLII